MDGLFLVLAIITPIIGLVLAALPGGASPSRLIAGATLGGLMVGFAFVATVIAQVPVPDSAMIGAMAPWVLFFAYTGFVIGIGGVLLRLLNRWLASR